MKERLTYEAPLARDLSAFGASGQWPLGNCTHGNVAHDTCVNGATQAGQCNVGGTADSKCPVGFSPKGPPAPNCSNGSYPTVVGCSAGYNPSECNAGTSPI